MQTLITIHNDIIFMTSKSWDNTYYPYKRGIKTGYHIARWD